MNRQCCHCKKRKPLTEFYKSSTTVDGFSRTCTPCKRELEAIRKSTRTYDLFGNVVTKLCNRCRCWLPAADFNTRRAVSDRLSNWCRSCHAIRNAEVYIRPTRNRALQRAYDISQAEWDVLFESQGRACAACGSAEGVGWRGWCTDHIHGTKTVRGILCGGCNLAIGHLKDNPERAERLGAYLRRSQHGVSSLAGFN